MTRRALTFVAMANLVFNAAYLSVRATFDAVYWTQRAAGAPPKTAFYNAAAKVMTELAGLCMPPTHAVPPQASDDERDASEEATALMYSRIADPATVRNLETIREALHLVSRGAWDENDVKFDWPDLSNGPVGTRTALATLV